MLTIARATAWLLLAATPVAGPAAAASFERTDVPGSTTPGILLSGRIDPGDQAAFHALAAGMANAIVVTTGPGGSVFAAIAIGTEIRNRGWSTLVPADAYCASACSMIWLAGTRRYLADGGRIGFHAMSINQNGVAVETHQPDVDLRRWLTDLGYSDDTTATIVNTPSRLIHWRDRLELQANGIPTEPFP
jgi:hypothetical protein